MAKSKWMLVDTGGKLYLYAESLEDRERLNRASRYTSPDETARPLSKADCVNLAAALLNHVRS